MKTKIEIPQDILSAIDYANTTNGGMTEPILTVTQEEEGYEVRVKVAGLNTDDFEVDVLNNRLWVYHLVTLFAQRPEGMDNFQIPRTLGNLLLPNDVEVEGIVAHYNQQSRELNIHLPYNQRKRNFRRHIDIER